MTNPTETLPASPGPDAAPRAAPASTPFPDPTYAWFVVGALALINMVSFVERMLPTLLFEPIKKDFLLNDTQVSLLAGFAFVIFYTGFGLVIGRMADRKNRKRIIMIGIVLWGMATAFCGLARNFAQLFMGRVMVGVGEATLGPSAISMISDYFPRDRLARALSFYTSAQYFGAGFALVVGGFAIQMVSAMTPPVVPFIGELRPWQTTFLFVGLFGMVVLIPLMFVKEPKRRGRMTDAPAEAALPLSQTFVFIRNNWKTFAAHFSAFALHGTIGFGTVAWMPSYFIRVHHWSAHDIGYIYGLMFAGLGGAGVIAGARLAEWVGARGYRDTYFRTPIITFALTIVPAVLATLMPTAGLSLFFLVFATFLASFPVAMTIAALQVITPNEMRGQVLAIFFLIANIMGVGLGPTLVAAITDYVYRDEMMVGYSLATATVIIMPVIMLILWAGLKPYRESLTRAEQWNANPN